MHCSIAHTTSGKHIFVDTWEWKEMNLEDAYTGFNNLELLEALLIPRSSDSNLDNPFCTQTLEETCRNHFPSLKNAARNTWVIGVVSKA